MFGYRSDGKKVKNMNIIEKAGPFFMPQRIDAVNLVNIDIPCGPIDDFIMKERRNGRHYTYTHILFATLIRVLYTREKMNRFIIRGTTYQRKYISISMDIKKKLEDDGEDITLKLYFTGRESLEEIKQMLDGEIAKNLKPEEVHKTTKVAGKFCHLPDFLFRWALAFIRWLDKHGMMPKSLIKASPFHTSCFITNLKSIKLPSIYHHLYNFGTTSMFISMGKEGMKPYVENNKELKVGKFLTLKFTLDERIADGFYMGRTLKLCKDLLANPENLVEKMPEDGSIPKRLLKKKSKKVKTKSKKTKDAKLKDKPRKIKPLLNKIKHDNKNKKKLAEHQSVQENVE